MRMRMRVKMRMKVRTSSVVMGGCYLKHNNTKLLIHVEP